MDPVVHFEIPVDNRDRAVKFYEKTFGWHMHHVPEMKYVVATTTPTGDNRMPKKVGEINGGLMPREGKKLGPVVVINVKSITEHLKKVSKNGGKTTLKRVKVGDMGYYGRVKDTEGNEIGLWEDKK